MSQEISRKKVIIGTRESALALWQAKHVCSILEKAYPQVEFEIAGMTTSGDRDLVTPLHAFQTKGVFTKELDVALDNKRIDIAVHCVKDMATTLPDGQVFCAIIERGETDDVVVLHEKHIHDFLELQQKEKDSGVSVNRRDRRSRALSFLPPGSVIGTSSLRRTGTIARFHPGLVCRQCRGNVATRLSKLDDNQYDAIILARIGLERLGYHHRIAEALSSEVYSTAVGQGALAVVCRSDDEEVRELVSKALHHAPTEWVCSLERGMLKNLQGGCKVPIAVHTSIEIAPTSDAQLYVEMIDTERNNLIEAQKQKSENTQCSGDSSSETKIDSAVSVHVEPNWKRSEEKELNEDISQEDAQDKSYVITSRGTVMTLDGKTVLECVVALEFPVYRPDGTARSSIKRLDEIESSLAHSVGSQLGESLRLLGAETILKEAREE